MTPEELIGREIVITTIVDQVYETWFEEGNIVELLSIEQHVTGFGNGRYPEQGPYWVKFSSNTVLGRFVEPVNELLYDTVCMINPSFLSISNTPTNVQE